MNSLQIASKAVVNERTARKIITLNNEDFMRRIPYEQDAEKSLIGSILINPALFYDVVSLPLTAEDFYLVRHNRLFKCLEQIEQADGVNGINSINLTSKLKDNGWYEENGGGVYLSELMNMADIEQHAIVYGKMILYAAIRRRTILACDQIKMLAIDKSVNIEQFTQAANEALFLATEQAIQEDATDAYSIVQEYWDRMDYARANPAVAQGMPFPFAALSVLVQLYRREVTYLAGMPKMGKTQILIEIARFVAGILKLRVVIFTREMDRMEIMNRFVAIETGIAVSRLKEPSKLTDAEHEHMSAAYGNIANWKLNIIHCSTLTPLQLKRHLKKLQREYALELVIVDGLWLMDADAPHDRKDRKDQLDYITKMNHDIAIETNLRFLVTHQLNRDAVHRPDHRPRMADFADSSSVEKNANTLIAIYRDDYPDFRIADAIPGEAELHVLSTRDSGITGVAPIEWRNGRYVDRRVK